MRELSNVGNHIKEAVIGSDKIKYYEFIGFEYYALIQARGELDALRQYESDVVNLEGDELNKKPTELSKKEAIERVERSGIAHDETSSTKIMINMMDTETPMTLLIDNSLC